MKKLKILSISHYYATDNRGGGEIMLHELLKSLVDRGHRVDAVATWTKGMKETLDGVNVYKGVEHRSLITRRYDLVVTHFHEANYVIKYCRQQRVPVVFIVHNSFDNAAETLRLRPNLVVFNSHWIKEHHQYPGKSIVIHPPVRMEQHATTPGERVTLINMIPSKGCHVFYHLAQRMRDVPFLAVEGGYYKERQIKYPMLKNVRYQDNTPNMKDDVWADTKILLMPSEYESYGMVGLEAMSSGIPVIARKTPGLEESLGDAGIFPPNFSVIEWQRYLRWAMQPETYVDLSKKALKRARSLEPDKELAGFVESVEDLKR